MSSGDELPPGAESTHGEEEVSAAHENHEQQTAETHDEHGENETDQQNTSEQEPLPQGQETHDGHHEGVPAQDGQALSATGSNVDTSDQPNYTHSSESAPVSYDTGNAGNDTQGAPAASSEPTDPNADNTRLHVSNLPFRVRDDELRAMFEPFGVILDCEIICNERGSKGFGFLTFEQHECAKAAKEALCGTMIDNRRMDVNWATRRFGPPRNRQNQQWGNNPYGAWGGQMGYGMDPMAAWAQYYQMMAYYQQAQAGAGAGAGAQGVNPQDQYAQYYAQYYGQQGAQAAQANPQGAPTGASGDSLKAASPNISGGAQRYSPY